MAGPFEGWLKLAPVCPVLDVSTTRGRAAGLSVYVSRQALRAAFLNGTIPDRLALYTAAEGGSWLIADNWTGLELPDEQTDVMIVPAVTIDALGAPGAADDLIVLPGGALSLANGGLNAATLNVMGGGALRLYGAQSELSVQSLTLDQGAELSWKAGAISLIGPEPRLDAVGELQIGAPGAPGAPGANGGPAVLRLGDGAIVWAEQGIRIGRAGEVVATPGGGGGGGDGSGGAGGFVLHGLVQNHGIVTALGAVDVVGDYAQGSTGVLRVELREGGHGVLSIANHAALAGTLELILEGGWRPAEGDRFDIVLAPPGSPGPALASGGVGGRFDRLIAPRLPAGLRWSVEYGADRATIVVSRSSLPSHGGTSH